MSELKAPAEPKHLKARGPAPETRVLLGTWQVTEESVLRYIRAVGDTPDLYLQSRLAPPIALAAWSLGGMLEHLDLPPGAIHSLQEMETVRGIQFGESITAFARLGPPRRRGDMEFITAFYTLKADGGEEVMRGKTTVLVNRGATASSENGGFAENQDSGEKPRLADTQAPDQENPSALPQPDLPPKPGHLPGIPVVERTITQDQLNVYSKASGDYNPLHLDSAFAATTQFGGIIAHGMLNLALVSEAMGRAYGRAWLESGTLAVKFKGAAYLGDHLYAECDLSKQQSVEQDLRQVCAVGVRERESGRVLVSGSASVIINGENSG